MKTINYLIIEVDNQYNNEIKLSNGADLIVNTTIESVIHINRTGRVVSVPSFVTLEEGDSVIVHHNILRIRNDNSGKEIQSDYHIKDNLFFVPLHEVYMYKRDGEWNALDPYCFLRPIKKEIEEKTSSGLFIPNPDKKGYNGFEPNMGELVYGNKQLTEIDANKGDVLYFADDSEYEFEVDGEVLYRMKTNDILAKHVQVSQKKESLCMN